MSDRTFYATTYVVADGVTRTWPFSFAGVNTGQESGVAPYLYPEDVKVQEIYTDADGNKQTVQRTGVLNAPNQITIDGPAIIAGREIRIYRETELRFPLVDYRDLQSVSEHDLDLANRQAVFIAQETRDTASANLVYDKQGHFNAGGRRIVNLAPGVDNRDAVNVQQFKQTVRGPANDELVPLPGPEQRKGKVLSFDPVTGQPIVDFPFNHSALELEMRLARSGTTMIGMPGTELTVDQILRNRVFPNIVLGRVTTSSAGIVSTDVNDDKSAEIQALIDANREVVIDTQVAINQTINVTTRGSRVLGSATCMVLVGPGMGQKSMFKITGHDSVVDALTMDNPLMVKNHLGGRQTAINIQADNVMVKYCVFRRMLHAVCTEANGEWYMPTYMYNLAYDCLGTGLGPTDDGTDGRGERAGDAFLIWGATGKMLYNRAFCMEGQDARIAFHCESLGQNFTTRPHNPKRDGKDYMMIGNYAYGAFRRHFAFENASRAIMADNISAGGATWWPIAVTGGHDIIVHDMLVYYTRMPTDNSGGAWSPDRGGFMLGFATKNVRVTNVIIKFAPGASGAGITTLINPAVSTDVTLDNVHVIRDVGTTGLGFVLDKLANPKVRNCSITGGTDGITTFGAQDVSIENFDATDLLGTVYRLSGGNPNTAARISGGRILRVKRGVNATNVHTLSVKRMTSKTVEIDIEQYGGTDVTILHCHNEDGTGKLVGMNSPFTLNTVRHIKDNFGYVYDLRFAAQCFTSKDSWLNKTKRTGQTEVSQEGSVFVAVGSTPESPWRKVTTTDVVPT